MKMHLLKPRHRISYWAALLAIFYIILIPASSQTRPVKPRPTPPRTGTPPNSSSGATRPEKAGGCPVVQPPLTALNKNGKDYTLSEQPTLWFYIPYTSTEVQSIEFTLHNAQLTKTLYRATVPAPATAGIIAVPTQSSSILETGKNYRWKLVIQCKSKSTDEPDLVVNGWLQRLELPVNLSSQIRSASPRQRTQLYLDADGWYDALTNLAELRLKDPQDPTLQDQWRQLLKTAGWNDLTEKPLMQP